MKVQDIYHKIQELNFCAKYIISFFGYEIGFPGCTAAICTSFIDGTCIEFMINKTGYMYFTVSLNQPLDH